MGTGTASDATDGEAGLLSAVGAGDTVLVKRLLQEDSDPGLREAAFCLAVRTYAGDIAQLLLQYGADAGRCGPEELLPLRDAVESGSPALVEALLDQRIRGRYPQTELLEMRDLARRFYTRWAPERNCVVARAPRKPSSTPGSRTTSTTASAN